MSIFAKLADKLNLKERNIISYLQTTPLLILIVGLVFLTGCPKRVDLTRQIQSIKNNITTKAEILNMLGEPVIISSDVSVGLGVGKGADNWIYEWRGNSSMRGLNLIFTKDVVTKCYTEYVNSQSRPAIVELMHECGN